METIDIFMQAVSVYVKAYGEYFVAITLMSVFALSLVFKPIIKKILYNKRSGAILQIEDVRALHTVETSKDGVAMTQIERQVSEAKIDSYEAQIKECEVLMSEKWMSDTLSEACFAVLCALCFVGACVQFFVQTASLSFLSNAAFYVYVCAAVCVCEAAYSLYEKFGLKKLYKLILEKIKN